MAAFPRAGRRVLRSHLAAAERRVWFELLESLARDGDPPGAHAEALCELSLCWRDLGDVARSLECAHAAQRTATGDAAVRADVLYSLGRAQQYAGQSAEAVKSLGECVELRRARQPPHLLDVLEALSALASCWDELGESAAVTRTLEPVLRDVATNALAESPTLAECYRILGVALGQQGELERAQHYCERALDLDCRLLSPRHPAVAIDWNDLSFVHFQRGNRGRALECMLEALEIERSTSGESHPSVGLRWLNLGAIWREMGDARRAVDALERALAIYERSCGERHLHLVSLLGHLGRSYLDLDQRPQAVAALARAVALRREIAPENQEALESDLRILAAARDDS